MRIEATSLLLVVRQTWEPLLKTVTESCSVANVIQKQVRKKGPGFSRNGMPIFTLIKDLEWGWTFLIPASTQKMVMAG